MTERTAINPAEIAGVHRPLTLIEIAEDLESGMNSYGTCALAAKTIREQHAEIDRLQSRFDSKKFTHRQDCCGAQIETRCLGCAMADLNCSMAEDDTMRAEIARLTGENAVLRDLLRSALAVVCTIDGEDDDEVASLYALTSGMREAIDGHPGGLFDEAKK